MIFLVILGYSVFKFDNSEDAVLFLEKAKFNYYSGDNPCFSFQILTEKEFEKYEKELLQRKEEIEYLNRKE